MILVKSLSRTDEQTLAVFDDSTGLSIVDTGSLVIGTARVDHSGTYVCIVSNPAGIATRDYTVDVQGKYNTFCSPQCFCLPSKSEFVSL